MTDTILMQTDVPGPAALSGAERAPELVGFKHVLVGVDGTSAGRDAIALGETLRNPDGRLTFAHVVLAQSPIWGNFHPTPAGRQTREMLERERVAAGVSAELTGMFAVSVGIGLHQLAKDLGADLLVVGSCRRGSVGRLLRGDDTRDSVSRAACAVAVAPDGYGDRSSRIKTVGVAYNASPEANAALAVARGLAARGGASLQALTVVGVAAAAPGAWGEVDGGWGRTVDASEHEAIGALRDLDAVQHRVALGHTATELIAFGDEVDLLVVGSRGYGPLRRLVLGSTSLRLAREARCPLLIIPRAAIATEAADAT